MASASRPTFLSVSFLFFIFFGMLLGGVSSAPQFGNTWLHVWETKPSLVTPPLYAATSTSTSTSKATASATAPSGAADDASPTSSAANGTSSSPSAQTNGAFDHSVQGSVGLALGSATAAIVYLIL